MVKRQSNFGCRNMRPVRIEARFFQDYVLYTQKRSESRMKPEGLDKIIT